ncbi:MAG: glucosyltransferase domain-containing protein, partial [Oscillospiraceae bacterium]|nr:glucosyltransferase domain-containing protein [Oscillospiraceae bacterium]
MLQRLREPLLDPDGWLLGLWRRTPAHIRTTFFSAAALGLATHLYVFTNKFANHDDLYQLFRGGYGVFSGRWLLPTVLRMDGSFSVPWLIGLLGVLFLSLGACVAVSLLRIRRPLGCLLAGAALVSFPSVTATLGYLFTSDAYFLGLLLAELGAWATVRRGWWGSALGAALFCL